MTTYNMDEKIDLDKLIREFLETTENISTSNESSRKFIRDDNDCPCCNLKTLFEK
jgi:hypothetical protein